MLHALSTRRTGCSVLALAFAFALAAVTVSAPAIAAGPTEIKIEIKDHKFSPAEIKVPAGTPIKLIVKNSDPTPEEFDSYPLGVEKVIAGNSEGTVRIRPLEKGSYDFMGKYHVETALGTLIAE